MYIKKEDFSYFEGLYKSLDEEREKRFLDILLKSAGKKAGKDVAKIEVVGDEIYDSRGKAAAGVYEGNRSYRTGT